MFRKKSRYAWHHWKIVLYNVFHEDHEGWLQLFKQHVKDEKQKSTLLFAEMVDKVIEKENDDVDERTKQAIFFEKTNLTGKFLSDMRNPLHSPNPNMVMAIIMGHSCKELSNDFAQKLLEAAGVSLENKKELSIVYNFLRNIRGTKKFEKEVAEMSGANGNSKRITTANQILLDIYQANIRYKKIFSRTKRKRFPAEFVLGKYVDPEPSKSE